jgi:hypothetical protein
MATTKDVIRFLASAHFEALPLNHSAMTAIEEYGHGSMIFQGKLFGRITQVRKGKRRHPSFFFLL